MISPCEYRRLSQFIKTCSPSPHYRAVTRSERVDRRRGRRLEGVWREVIRPCESTKKEAQQNPSQGKTRFGLGRGVFGVHDTRSQAVLNRGHCMLYPSSSSLRPPRPGALHWHRPPVSEPVSIRPLREREWERALWTSCRQSKVLFCPGLALAREAAGGCQSRWGALVRVFCSGRINQASGIPPRPPAVLFERPEAVSGMMNSRTNSQVPALVCFRSLPLGRRRTGGCLVETSPLRPLDLDMQGTGGEVCEPLSSGGAVFSLFS